MITGRDIARGLRRSYSVMHRQAQALLARHEITTDQYVLLALLSLEDGVTQSELAVRAWSDPNTIRAILLLMESKGLIVRKPHETDRRARRVLLTAKGRRLYPRLAAALKPMQDALLAPFDEREADQLVDFFRRIDGAMRQWDLERKSFSNVSQI